MKSELRLMFQQKQVQEVGVINGFCYPYARLLLDKLLALKQESRLYEENSGAYTDVCNSVLSAIQEQVNLSSPINDIELDNFIKSVQEFLAIFESGEH